MLAVILTALAQLGGCAGHKPPVRGPSPPGAAAPVAAPPPPPITERSLLTLPPMQAAGREAVRVGLLLPLSGPQASLGRAMLDSAELAVFESGRKDLLLMPADTQGSAAAAVDAANKLVSQGAEILLGPLLSDEVSAVAPIALSNRVPLVGFSSNMQVAGPGVYLLSFPPALEVERVVGYAVANGKTRIAAMIPENSYGMLIESALRDAVTAHNATLGPVEHYPTQIGQMQAPVGALAKADGFDAVLLPDGGTNLRALGPLLPYAGIDLTKVKVLGTGLWDDPTIGREPTLQGGWFAGPPPEARLGFAQRYRTAYGNAAPRIASLAYDGVALVAALADGPPGRRFTPERLASPNGFVGVDGVFRFDTDGHIARGLAVNEVTPAGVNVVSPAPKTFQARVN
jgi:ABC-type branched-subunit amino acid transport system substrate-binding protein